jgi:AmiR/NasT family two-component response regulator
LGAVAARVSLEVAPDPGFTSILDWKPVPAMTTRTDKAPTTLGPREAITRAVDLLIAQHGVSQAEAFEMLVQGSADSSERVQETANRIVVEASRRD